MKEWALSAIKSLSKLKSREQFWGGGKNGKARGTEETLKLPLLGLDRRADGHPPGRGLVWSETWKIGQKFLGCKSLWSWFCMLAWERNIWEVIMPDTFYIKVNCSWSKAIMSQNYPTLNMGDLIKWASPTYCKPKGSHRVSIVQILTFFKRPLKIMRKSVGKM